MNSSDYVEDSFESEQNLWTLHTGLEATTDDDNDLDVVGTTPRTSHIERTDTHRTSGYGSVSSSDSFVDIEEDTRCIVEALIYESGEQLNSRRKQIYQDLLHLKAIMRETSAQHYEEFEERLFTALKNSNSLQPGNWLKYAFNDLIKKLGKTPSWRAVVNMLNAICLIIPVAHRYENCPDLIRRRRARAEGDRLPVPINIAWLKNEMQGDLNNYLHTNFYVFISNMGGWNDLSAYYKDVRNRIRPVPLPEPRTSVTESLGLTMAAVATMAVGAIFLSKKV